MPGVIRSPGFTGAVLAAGALCFGAAYLGGTLTRDRTSASGPVPARAAEAPPPIPVGRIRPLAGAEQIPGLRVPRTVPHRTAAPPAATSAAHATAVARAVAPARSTPVRSTPARTVTPQSSAPAPTQQRTTPVSNPTPSPSPTPAATAPKQQSQPAARKPAASEPVTFFDDGAG
jgi:hypothetical protein